MELGGAIVCEGLRRGTKISRSLGLPSSNPPYLGRSHSVSREVRGNHRVFQKKAKGEIHLETVL